MIADLFGALAGAVYIVLMVAAFVVSRGATKTSLRRLTAAVRLYAAAAATEAVALVAHLADVREDGWLWPLVSAATLTFTALALKATRERRALKGDRVVADAERTVHDWTGGTS